MIWLYSLVGPALAAVLLAVVGGQFWAWTGSRRLGLAGDDAARYRASARILGWVVAPAAFAGFWVATSGDLVGLVGTPATVLFFVLWLGGANLLLLISRWLPVVGRLAEPAASDMRDQYFGGAFNK